MRTDTPIPAQLAVQIPRALQTMQVPEYPSVR